MTKTTYTKNHPLVKKKKALKGKMLPITRHNIVKYYIAYKANKSSSPFNKVDNIAKKYNISRSHVYKLKNKFNKLWEELHPWEPIDYSINVFQERDKLTKHRVNLDRRKKINKLLYDFIKRYPKWWYVTYKATLNQKEVEDIYLYKESTFKYYKPIVLKELWIEKNKKAYKKKQEASYAKRFFNSLYKQYDVIINIDWKCLSDIPMVQKNPAIATIFKRITMAVEVKSWALVKAWLEFSHNKSNAFKIVKDIVTTIEEVFGPDVKILFLSDAWSEYLNKKELRGLEITDLDTTKMAEYLSNKGHGWMITRFKQDNGFIENKNNYIETACLDNYEIMNMNKQEFVNDIQRFIDVNNSYLESTTKTVFRGKWNTPKDNLISRFGEKKAEEFLSLINVEYLWGRLKVPREHENHTSLELLMEIYPHLHITSKQDIEFKKVLPFSLDSTFFIIFSCPYNTFCAYSEITCT